MSKIFLVEDDLTLCQELQRILELSGYEYETCEDFKCAAQEALASSPDCVLLDLKLPGADGHAICRELRAQSQVPIIVLTSCDTEFDEVMSMNLGADDFVTKPYKPAVLLARMQSVMRRSASTSGIILSHKGVRLDVSKAVVEFEGKVAELSRNELRILQILMRNATKVVTRQEIMCELWQSDEFIDDNTLTVNVNRLRKNLSSAGVPDDFLQTKRGMGYILP